MSLIRHIFNCLFEVVENLRVGRYGRPPNV